MRSVRCDACGTRALMAASKCPKCGHEIEVRDGFGEMLPLAHCSTCDSFYPSKLGACRWCGTKPERAPIGPFVWKGVGVATFVAMAWGAWLVHDDPPAEVSQARLAAVLKPDTSAGSLDSSLAAAATGDSIPLDSVATFDSTTVVASDSTIQSVASVVAAISDSMGQSPSTAVDSAPIVAEPVAQTAPTPEPETLPAREPATTRDLPRARTSIASGEKEVGSSSVPAAEPPPVAVTTRAPAPAPAKSRPARSTTRTLARAPERTAARSPARTPSTKPAPRAASTSKAPPKATVKAPSRGVAKAPAPAIAKAPVRPRTTRVVWVNSVARNWVIVRASADRSARVIASIGPNTRVQLGEARGGWRRIRAKGLAGWVEHRSFFAGTGTSRKTGSLAAR